MRRLTAITRWVTGALWDFTHAARDQTGASWLRLRGGAGYTIAQADCSPIPVVLLPGILERSTYLAPLGRFLAGQGHPVHVIDALGWNLATIDDSVEFCLKVLRDQDVHGAVFVAHSKGGLIGKALLLDPRVGDAAIGLIAIATPFAGSTFGGPLQKLPLVEGSPLGLFLPGSPDIERLAENDDVNSNIVSLAPAWDQMIPGGSELRGAINVTLEGRGHFRPVNDPRVWKQVHTHIHTLAEQRIHLDESEL
ncbi:MAG: esterase/lipase family protein [Arachnia sp.]